MEAIKDTAKLFCPQPDERFGTYCSDNTIINKGVSLLVNTGSNVQSENWVEHLDRKKIVSYSYPCFKRILSLLRISDNQCSEIMHMRRRENKRVSTSKFRSKKKTREYHQLCVKKTQLQREKEKLVKEINFYRSFSM